jgi:hypothetical protein
LDSGQHSFAGAVSILLQPEFVVSPMKAADLSLYLSAWHGVEPNDNEEESFGRMQLILMFSLFRNIAVFSSCVR